MSADHRQHHKTSQPWPMSTKPKSTNWHVQTSANKRMRETKPNCEAKLNDKRFRGRSSLQGSAAIGNSISMVGVHCAPSARQWTCQGLALLSAPRMADFAPCWPASRPPRCPCRTAHTKRHRRMQPLLGIRLCHHARDLLSQLMTETS